MEEIETILLAGLLYNGEFLTKTIVYFKEDLFAEQKHKIIFKNIKNYYSKYSKQPEYTTIFFESTDNPELGADTIKEIKKTMKEIEDMKVPSIEWLLENSEKFIRNKMTKEAILKAVAIYDGDDKKNTIDSIPELLREAVTLSFDNKVGTSFLKDVEARYDYYTNPEAKIPTGLACIDDRTSGGMPTKILAAVMAATNVGKTLALCSLASSYSDRGYNVLYISLEMSENEILKRIDANKLNVDMRDFAKIDKDKYLASVVNIKERGQGDVVVKNFPPTVCTVNHIRKVCKELKVKDKFKPDILIVDYLGLMASSLISKMNSKSYEYQKSIAEELRGLMVELDVVGWTAVQTNRGGVGDEGSDLDKVADSYGVPMTLDYVLSMWRTPEGDEFGVIYAQEKKSRFGNKAECPVLQIGVDLYKQRLFDVTTGTGVNNVRKMKEDRKTEEYSSNRKDNIKAKLSMIS